MARKHRNGDPGANEEREMQEALDNLERTVRAEERKRKKELKEARQKKLEADHRTVRDVASFADFMMKASLLLAGFKQHDRSIYVKMTPKNSPLLKQSIVTRPKHTTCKERNKNGKA